MSGLLTALAGGGDSALDWTIWQPYFYLLSLLCLPPSYLVTNPGNPDFISIDLDPSDEDFGKAIKQHRRLKSFLTNGSLLRSMGKMPDKLIRKDKDWKN
jgi:hypothetical protein